MAEPPPHKTICSASLLSLPPGLGENVWQELKWGSDRSSLLRASKATQSLFSPAVERLTYRLPDTLTHCSPSSGLHKDVQPRWLRIHGSASREEQQGDEGSAHASQLAVLSSIPHWSRLQRLDLHKIKLDQEVANSLDPLLQLSTLKHLYMAGCELHVSSLPCITAIKHLEQLHLMNVKLVGDMETLKEAPPAVSGPPSVTLVMAAVTAGQPGWVYSLLRFLGPCLRSIKYTEYAAEAGTVQQVLKAASEGHLFGLRRLFVKYESVKGWVVSKEYIEVLPATCPLLEYLRLDNVVLPDRRLLPILMAMPALEHLELYAAAQKEVFQAAATPLAIHWPGDKEPMCLKLQLLQASFIPALPLQHISKLRCETLEMQATPDSSVAGETQKLRRLLELLQSKGAVLEVGRILGSRTNGQWVSAGLSALTGPGCRIVFYKPMRCMVANMLLDVADITAIARTWGSQLYGLILKCKLTPSALAAITPSSFPRLTVLSGLYCSRSGYCAFIAALVALCMDWPRNQYLEVAVRQSTHLTEPVATVCWAALHARGRVNVRVKVAADL